ncbi:MAG: hypothetical protein AB1634_14340 [Thermodesulfobacteriota bacterium]
MAIPKTFAGLRLVSWDARFEKSLNDLQRAGGNSAIAARNAESIIRQLQTAGRDRQELLRRSTKHGESRLKGCLKFNLGNGYRLISLLAGGELRLLFAGSHDDCDLWLEKNRGLELTGGDTRIQVVFPELAVAPVRPRLGEEEPARPIDDQTLRQVFRGLVIGR